MSDQPAKRHKFTPEDSAKGGRRRHEIGERRPKRPDDIRWVAENLETDESAEPVTESDAPTLVAWSMLQWAKSSDESKSKFWSVIFPRLVAREARQENAERERHDGNATLTRAFETLERERPDLAALSRERIYGNTVNGKYRCPNCGAISPLTGGGCESAGTSIGKVGAVSSVEISQ